MVKNELYSESEQKSFAQRLPFGKSFWDKYLKYLKSTGWIFIKCSSILTLHTTYKRLVDIKL